MGKNFPQITTLKEKPHCLEKTIKLIESSFHYKKPFSFSVDFAPLMDASNHSHNFILLDETEEVLAHVGARIRKLRLGEKEFDFCLLGGIAVDERFRGQGHFQTLFQDVLAEFRSDVVAFVLWSDQEKLYSKYGFHLAGGQYELSQRGSPAGWKKTTYSALSTEEKGRVRELYKTSFQKTYLTCERDEKDWDLIAAITSSELYLSDEGYAFLGKGQDLEGIVHEYGCAGDLTAHLQSARALGKLWMGAPLVDADQAQYQFLCCPGDTKRLTEFVSVYTRDQLRIRDVNVMKQETFFDFNGETLVLPTGEFLQGVLGPGPFEELGELRPFFIGGLDSI